MSPRNRALRVVGLLSLCLMGKATWAQGTVSAWGFWGQLGDGTATNSYTPVQVTGLTGVVALGGGRFYSLALRSDGTVWAWGANNAGQMGNVTNTGSNTPAQVTGLTGVSATGKCVVQDVTNPASPVSIYGGATLQVTTANSGTPQGGATGTGNVEVQPKAGGLWIAAG